MKQDNQFDSAMEEINSAKTMIERDTLLQKYGFIPAKLTPFEKSLVTKQAIIYYRIREVA